MPKITFIDGDFKHKVNTHDESTTWYMESGVLNVSSNFCLKILMYNTVPTEQYFKFINFFEIFVEQSFKII